MAVLPSVTMILPPVMSRLPDVSKSSMTLSVPLVTRKSQVVAEGLFSSMTPSGAGVVPPIVVALAFVGAGYGDHAGEHENPQCKCLNRHDAFSVFELSAAGLTHERRARPNDEMVLTRLTIGVSTHPDRTCRLF